MLDDKVIDEVLLSKMSISKSMMLISKSKMLISQKLTIKIEASGLAVSELTEGLLWTITDHGGENRVYGLTEDGNRVVRITQMENTMKILLKFCQEDLRQVFYVKVTFPPGGCDFGRS